MSDSARDGEGSVRLVGTAHVSADSVAEVERVIEEEEPDAVAVELDEGRYRQMKGGTPDEIAPADLLQGSMALQFLAYWLLSYVQQRLGERFDIDPGADMLAAVEKGEAVGSEVALVDRDIQVTIQRFWARMSLLEKLRLVGQLGLAVVGVGGEEEEELEMAELTDTDVVSAMMEEFREFSPKGAEALIDERDAYLAHNILRLREQGKRVVAVVGAGHKAGIERYLEHPEELPPMEDLTGRAEKRFSLLKVAGSVLTLAFLAFFALVLMAGVSNGTLLRLFAAWFLFNGVIAAGLALLGGAHWTSAGVGGAVAWLTSINPLLAPGWFAGYVELRYTPVRISDIGRLNDILSDETLPIREVFARMTDVPLFRLIAVVALTNLGSMIASFLFIPLVLPFVGGDLSSASEIMTVLVQGAQNSLDLLRVLVP
ncbi:probable plasmid transfer protein [Halarchaeum acidiphilum MH1-52-1]|uniref:Probable plasmid transfer protein n=1 Tax=Halarchaeum acidiphilum MH1-52-1 TaxID=1261545 RepID=U2YF30_9EURY|nr:TraB/GumN family protein [Halarchaeum acidiphilum]GAD52546.1 probable plasmid transfer protein [Halarchaeum acidiphilum MH1-52-1]